MSKAVFKPAVTVDKLKSVWMRKSGRQNPAWRFLLTEPKQLENFPPTLYVSLAESSSSARDVLAELSLLRPPEKKNGWGQPGKCCQSAIFVCKRDFWQFMGRVLTVLATHIFENRWLAALPTSGWCSSCCYKHKVLGKKCHHDLSPLS